MFFETKSLLKHGFHSSTMFDQSIKMRQKQWMRASKWSGCCFRCSETPIVEKKMFSKKLRPKLIFFFRLLTCLEVISKFLVDWQNEFSQLQQEIFRGSCFAAFPVPYLVILNLSWFPVNCRVESCLGKIIWNHWVWVCVCVQALQKPYHVTSNAYANAIENRRT